MRISPFKLPCICSSCPPLAKYSGCQNTSPLCQLSALLKLSVSPSCLATTVKWPLSFSAACRPAASLKLAFCKLMLAIKPLACGSTLRLKGKLMRSAVNLPSLQSQVSVTKFLGNKQRTCAFAHDLSVFCLRSVFSVKLGWL